MRNPAITVVTSTRAEFGLLRPVVAKLCQNGPAPALVATGAHLCARLGATVAEIEADPRRRALPGRAAAYFFGGGPRRAGRAHHRAHRRGVRRVFRRAPPGRPGAAGRPVRDLCRGRRGRRAPCPIAHISGGDVTLGAADEYYRHCITHMAALHFPSCADSARAPCAHGPGAGHGVLCRRFGR